MEGIRQYLLNFLNEFGVSEKFGIFGALLVLILAAVYCVLGYKLVKVFVVLCGMIAGAGLGIGLAKFLHFDRSLFLVSIVLGTIILGVLAFIVFKFSLAFLVALSSFGLLLGVASHYLGERGALVVALLFAILLGVVTLWASRPVVIIVSALSGGFMVSAILFRQLLKPILTLENGNSLTLVVTIVGAILAGFGMFIQFRTK